MNTQCSVHFVGPEGSVSILGYVPRNLPRTPANEKGEVGAQQSYYWFHPLSGEMEKVPYFSQVDPARFVKVVRFGRCALPDGFPQSDVLYRLKQLRQGLRLLREIVLGRAHFATYGEALKPKVEPEAKRATVQGILPVGVEQMQKNGVHAPEPITPAPPAE